MKNILITALAVLYCIELGYGNDRINQGASTSTQLDDSTRCELQRNAHIFIHLITAEDENGGDVVDMANNRFEELEAFYAVVSAFPNLNSVPEPQRATRLQYFNSILEDMLKELLELACTSHYTHRYNYEYNQNERVIYVRESMGFGPGQCVCFDNHRERTRLSITPQLPLPKKPEKKFQILLSGDVSIDEVTVYYFIPLPLISRFFMLWLPDENTVRQHENQYNGCVNILIRRFRRSMHKILLYNMMRSGLYSNPSQAGGRDDFAFSDEVLTIEYLKKVRTWLSGNIFVGPADRGPTAPTFERSGEQLLEAFEYTAGPLISAHQYLDLLKVFHLLRRFVVNVPNMSIFERLYTGFGVFNLMSSALSRYPVTQLNIEQWKQETIAISRTPTSTDKPTIFKFDDKNIMKYWVIRQRRGPRASEYYTYETMENKEVTSSAELKNRWRGFVSDLMSISMDAKSRNQSLAWSCNLTYLYSEYMSIEPMLNFNTDHEECLRFDEFLYERIANASTWEACNFDPELSPVSKWCAAWRRIVKESADADYHWDNDTSGTVKPRWKLLVKKDVRTMVAWLMSPEKAMNDEEERSEFDFVPKYHQTELKSERPVSSVDLGLCMFSSMIPALMGLSWSDCRRSMKV